MQVTPLMQRPESRESTLAPTGYTTLAHKPTVTLAATIIITSSISLDASPLVFLPTLTEYCMPEMPAIALWKQQDSSELDLAQSYPTILFDWKLAIHLHPTVYESRCH